MQNPFAVLNCQRIAYLPEIVSSVTQEYSWIDAASPPRISLSTAYSVCPLMSSMM